MGFATVTSKGQLTIPADIRGEFGIEPGHKLYFFKQLDGRLGVHIVKPRQGAGFGILSHHADPARAELTRDEIGQAVADGVDEKIARTGREG